MMELVDMQDLGSCASSAWGFESLRPHQLTSGIAALRFRLWPAAFAENCATLSRCSLQIEA